jgi:hypothetical protein
MVTSITKFHKILYSSSATNGYSKLNPEFMIFIGAILVNVLFSYAIFERDPNSIVYYSDAISHLVISREMFDSLSPGFGQLGTVWLPMTHILLLPFVTSNFLFHTGLAGTFVSAISTAVTAVILFRISRLQFDSELAGILASSLFLLNLSVIYMGVVPMTELPFMMFFMISVYYIQQWYYVYSTDPADTWKQYRSIIKAAFAILATTLTAYNGWLLPFVLVFMLLAISRISDRRTSKFKIHAIIAAAVPYSFVGIIIWLAWNFLEQKDPLSFAAGPYSAGMETLVTSIISHMHLNPVGPLSMILEVSKAMYGMPVLILSIVGVVAYLYMKRVRRVFSFSALMLILLLIPTLSGFVGMILGYQEIFPARNGGWTNGQNLVFIAPFLAFTSAYIVVFIAKMTKKRVLTIFSLCCVVAIWMFTFGFQVFNIGMVVALNDTDSMIISLRSDQIALHTGSDLKKIYSQDGDILLFAGTQHSQEIMFESGIPLKNFIDTGSGNYWNTSRTHPWTYAEYIVLDRSSTQENREDPTYHMWSQWQTKLGSLLGTSGPTENHNAFRPSYHIIYQNDLYDILKRNSLTN